MGGDLRERHIFIAMSQVREDVPGPGHDHSINLFPLASSSILHVTFYSADHCAMGM